MIPSLPGLNPSVVCFSIPLGLEVPGVSGIGSARLSPWTLASSPVAAVAVAAAVAAAAVLASSSAACAATTAASAASASSSCSKRKFKLTNEN